MATDAKSAAKTGSVWKSAAFDAAGLDLGFNARRLRANLARNAPAMAALSALGLDKALVEQAGLGVKEPYVTAAGIEVSGVLTYPLDFSGGRCRYGYFAIDDITQNPDHSVAWSPGEARTIAFGDGSTLAVLATPVACLQARSVIEAKRLDIALLGSSQPDSIPREWMQPDRWAGWDRIVLDDALPATIQAAVAKAAMRPVEVAKGVRIETDPSRPISEVLEEWIGQMLSEARPFQLASATDCDLYGRGSGDYAAAPVSLHGGVIDGLMYYPFTIERRRTASGAGTLMCSYETLTLRSDGAVLEARTLPAPPGRALHQRVHCLADGTRIASPPQTSAHATWSFDGIQAFVADRAAGRDPVARPVLDILMDVKALFESRITLPEPSDTWVITAFVVMTHMFRVFPSIPLLLVEGPRGSGKSEIASAIAALSFNAVTMGQGSAAALVRIAQECGGLVVLDDVEGLSSGGSGFGELSQCLKVGYRSSTARKPIALGSGRVETFDFFGPRVLTCTRGVEPILRSRCISILTAPAAVQRCAYDLDLASLLGELHALGMTRAASVSDRYEEIASRGEDRADEIWAPLVAIAEVLGSTEFINAIASARARHVS
ncbi:hypothetical protein M9978_17525 [Sphingomonas sp. MG17]|uniref:Uncharacterized protein n=1 Tax=Sphingomonas tagetis TaxID=2949092 RepID=A0A9X2HMX1_9SPHN|nr:hypothetical protein [Sphingomonas tagetis]MCP3732224.1 hypothetical protein [Sphingomonas tagetis]